jgi:hypothetical protein
MRPVFSTFGRGLPAIQRIAEELTLFEESHQLSAISFLFLADG